MYRLALVGTRFFSSVSLSAVMGSVLFFAAMRAASASWPILFFSFAFCFERPAASLSFVVPRGCLRRRRSSFHSRYMACMTRAASSRRCSSRSCSRIFSTVGARMTGLKVVAAT